MSEDTRRFSAAAGRNSAPILAQLLRWLPPHGRALEIASGTGQHAAAFAQALPGWRWLPSDRDDDGFASIAAWCEGLPNVEPARVLDVTGAPWPVEEKVDAIFCANMLHISPWATCAGLMDGAARHLAAGGALLVYGPFRIGGQHTAPSNAVFDADLRARDPAWGVRDLDAVVRTAAAAGLALAERVAMPANNFLLRFTSAAAA